MWLRGHCLIEYHLRQTSTSALHICRSLYIDTSTKLNIGAILDTVTVQASAWDALYILKHRPPKAA